MEEKELDEIYTLVEQAGNFPKLCKGE